MEGRKETALIPFAGNIDIILAVDLKVKLLALRSSFHSTCLLRFSHTTDARGKSLSCDISRGTAFESCQISQTGSSEDEDQD